MLCVCVNLSNKLICRQCNVYRTGVRGANLAHITCFHTFQSYQSSCVYIISGYDACTIFAAVATHFIINQLLNDFVHTERKRERDFKRSACNIPFWLTNINNKKNAINLVIDFMCSAFVDWILFSDLTSIWLNHTFVDIWAPGGLTVSFWWKRKRNSERPIVPHILNHIQIFIFS